MNCCAIIVRADVPVKGWCAYGRAFPKSICSNPTVIGRKHSSSCIGLADHISGGLSLAVRVTLERPCPRLREVQNSLRRPKRAGGEWESLRMGFRRRRAKLLLKRGRLDSFDRLFLFGSASRNDGLRLSMACTQARLVRQRVHIPDSACPYSCGSGEYHLRGDNDEPVVHLLRNGGSSGRCGIPLPVLRGCRPSSLVGHSTDSQPQRPDSKTLRDRPKHQ